MSFFSSLFQSAKTPSGPARKPEEDAARAPKNPTLRTAKTKRPIEPGAKLGEGGEGAVFEVAGHPTLVAKIYHEKNRTPERLRKLETILAKRLDPAACASLRIAMPVDILLSDSGRFLGYLMPRVAGEPLKTAFFSRKRLAAKFPDADRKLLVRYAIHFLDQLRFLHGHGILVGDINPLNLLVPADDPAEGWLIDTDSFQVDGLPCPVGTDIFTPPRLQGKNFKTHLRTAEDELFSAAIMLFMILMLGKHPYSRIGGENPAGNIRRQAFPYRSMGRLDEVPPGVWGFIWSHFPRKLKLAFETVFREGGRPGLEEWRTVLGEYLYLLERGHFCSDIVPLSFRSRNSVRVECRDCGSPFQMDARFHESLVLSGKAPVCALCRQKFQATRLLKARHGHLPDTIRLARRNARHTRYKN